MDSGQALSSPRQMLATSGANLSVRSSVVESWVLSLAVSSTVDCRLSQSSAVSRCLSASVGRRLSVKVVGCRFGHCRSTVDRRSVVDGRRTVTGVRSSCEACIRSGRTDLLLQQLQRQKGPRSVAVKVSATSAWRLLSLVVGRPPPDLSEE